MIAAQASPRPTPTWIATRWQLRILAPIGLWFIGIALVLQLGTYLAIRAFGGQMEVSLWSGFVYNGPGWYLFSMAITLTSGLFAPHVGQGMTRRSFSHAQSLALLLLAAALAVWAPLLLGLEAGFYRMAGWGAPFPPAAESQTASMPYLALHFLMLYATYAAMGALVAATYYRFHALLATAALVLSALLPLGLVYTLLFPTNPVAPPLSGLLGSEGLTPASRMIAAGGLIAAMTLIRHGLLVGAPIRRKQG